MNTRLIPSLSRPWDLVASKPNTTIEKLRKIEARLQQISTLDNLMGSAVESVRSWRSRPAPLSTPGPSATFGTGLSLGGPREDPHRSTSALPLPGETVWFVFHGTVGSGPVVEVSDPGNPMPYACVFVRQRGAVICLHGDHPAAAHASNHWYATRAAAEDFARDQAASGALAEERVDSPLDSPSVLAAAPAARLLGLVAES